MKKTLATLLLGASTAWNALAGEPDWFTYNAKEQHIPPAKIELSEDLRSGKVVNSHLAGKEDVKVTSFIYEHGIITSKKSEYKHELMFHIKDKDTDIFVHDYGLDGLSEEDSFALIHKFKGGENMGVSLTYQGNGRYKANCNIHYPDGKDVGGCADTSRINPLSRMLINRKMKPVLDFGGMAYSNLLHAVNSKSPASLPYDEIKTALERVEPLLPLIKEGNGDANSALIRLANEYIGIAQKRFIENKK